jgi:hypothetical protein
MFLSTQDFQAYLPVTNAFSLTAADPFIRIALRTHLYPLFSKQELSHLVALQATNNLNPIQKEALDLLKEATAYFTFQAYKPYLAMQASDGGLHRVETDNLKPLFLRQEIAIEEANLQNAMQACNDALQLIEKNPATFTLWAASQAYTQHHTCFLQTTTQFEKYIQLQYANLVFARIKTVIQATEETYTQAILGTNLYNSLKTKLLANELTLTEQTLQEKINAYTALIVVANSFVQLNLSYQNGFLTTQYDQPDTYKQQKTPTADNLQWLLNNTKANAETKRQELIEFLHKQLPLFPLFATSDYYQPTSNQTTDNTTKQTTFWL